MTWLLLLASIACATEPPAHIRGMKNERDVGAMNQNFRAIGDTFRHTPDLNKDATFTQSISIDGDLTVIGNTSLNRTAVTATQSSGQTVPSGSTAKLVFDTEAFDTLNEWNTTASTFTPVNSGKYNVTAYVEIPTPDLASKLLIYYIYKNGVKLYESGCQNASIGNQISCGINAILDLTSSDWVEIFFFHNTGGSGETLDISGTWVSISRVD